MTATLFTPTPNKIVTAGDLGLITNALAGITNLGIMSAIGAASLAASTSATYVDVTGTGMTWNKLRDSASSDVIVLLALRAFTTVASTQLDFGINVGGTDYDVVRGDSNLASTHETYVGFLQIAGVAAGAGSPKVRFRRNSGTGAITINTGDTVAYLIGELPK